MRYVYAEPLFARGRRGELGVAAKPRAGEREPGDRRDDPGLDAAASEKMPEPRLDEQPMARLARIWIQRGER